MNAPERITLKGIRAAIIDLDGTMLDTAPDFHVAVNRMRADLGMTPVSMELVVDSVGKGIEHLVRCILAHDLDADGVEGRFEEALASYKKHYFAVNGDFATLYPQAMEGLAALRAKGLRLACVTNKPIAFTVPLLEKTGLAPYFEFVYGGDSFSRKKPDPYPLTKACEAFGLPPDQVVAIGDSSNDAQAARAAGCRILSVPYGYNHGRPVQEIDSDGIVATLLDAADIIVPQSP